MKRAEDIKKADEARVEAQKRLLSESKLSEGSQRIAKKFSSFEEREQMRKKAAEQRKQALEAQRARQRAATASPVFKFDGPHAIAMAWRFHAIDKNLALVDTGEAARQGK